MTDPRVVTVDGPAGSGKSTLGRALALALGLPLIDTGLFYRGILVAALRAGVDPTDRSALGEVARTTRLVVDTAPAAEEERVLVDGCPAGDLLRDPRHAAALARVSSTPEVRAAVLGPQRALATAGAVAVGRDCGTVVFPGAAAKFYLEAPEAVREQRRRVQLRARGEQADDTLLRAEVGARDRADLGRTASPLRPAADAHVIDTAAMSVEDMIAEALEVCRRAGVDAARTA